MDAASHPHLERLQRTAATTRDLIAHSRAPRWEVFAKASVSREIELRPERPLRIVHSEETGVAVRTFDDAGCAGFGAASGLEAEASRQAIDAALASAVPAPFDPLPPSRLLGVGSLHPPRELPARGWASCVTDELVRTLSRNSSFGLRRVVASEAAFSWLLTTADGFVAAHSDTTITIFAEIAVPSGVWREMVLVPDHARFDVEAVAEQISNRVVLMGSPARAQSGMWDTIFHPEVTAHVLAAFVPLFLARPADSDPLPRLLNREGYLTSPALSVVDDRASPGLPLSGPCDGEGLPAARISLLEHGVPRHRLASYRDATLCAEMPRGGALRVSYRDYPRTGAANLVIATDQGAAPRELLASAPRALYLLRPLAPLAIDFGDDSFRLIATGVWLDHLKVSGWAPAVELRGSVGQLLRRVEGVGVDRCWFQTEHGLVAAPSMLVRHQHVAG